MFIKKMKDIPLNTVSAGEKTSMQVLISANEAPNFAMRRFIIESGGGVPKHTNLVEHEQLVLRGKAEVGIGDKVVNVVKDDVVFIPAEVPHWYRNTGREPFEFICAVPNKEDKLTFINDD
ncbi:MAG: cupin [Spirochaeta sp. LUC14_002_19_P3]|nr:MAG: cupin [Spirochaeta sp. LUC14_002_19_P3]